MADFSKIPEKFIKEHFEKKVPLVAQK